MDDGPVPDHLMLMLILGDDGILDDSSTTDVPFPGETVAYVRVVHQSGDQCPSWNPYCYQPSDGYATTI